MLTSIAHLKTLLLFCTIQATLPVLCWAFQADSA
jgi:hypothetical protein